MKEKTLVLGILLCIAGCSSWGEESEELQWSKSLPESGTVLFSMGHKAASLRSE